jgi:hypothetical protein
MTDEERKQRGRDLEEMLDSAGGRALMFHVEERIREGWEDFIKLPADKKTSKVSYDAQAKYKVLKDLKEWVSDEIRLAKDLP